MKIIIDNELIKVTQKSNGALTFIDFVPQDGVELVALKQYGFQVHYELKTQKRVSKRDLFNGIGFSGRDKKELNLEKLQLKSFQDGSGNYRAIIPHR